MKKLTKVSLIVSMIAVVGSMVVSGPFGVKAEETSNKGKNESVKVNTLVPKNLESTVNNLEKNIKKLSNLEFEDKDLKDVDDRTDNRQGVIVGRNGETKVYNAVIREINSVATGTGNGSTTVQNLVVEIWFHNLRVRVNTNTRITPNGATLQVGHRVNIHGRMVETGDFRGVVAEKIFDHSAAPQNNNNDTTAIRERIQKLLDELKKLQDKLNNTNQ